jgi:hypothetical protein
VAEIAKREETGIRTIYRDLEALQVAGFPPYNEKVENTNRWAFIDTFKFKIPSTVFTQNTKFAKESLSGLGLFWIFQEEKGSLRPFPLGLQRIAKASES